MVSSSAVIAVLSLLSAPFALAQTCEPCDDVHFFLARGNNEPYPGRQGDLVAATCDGVSRCGYENLIYSALYTDLSCQTTYDGVMAGFTQLTSYAERCPNSKLILAGYSQGAQIVTDILGGGGGESFNGCIQPNTPPLDPTTSPGNRLNAVLTFGNTRHTANQPYNFGNGSSYDGLYPRTSAMLSALDSYTAITRDWCLETDPICADNQTNSLVSTHLSYYNVYSDDAAAWIKSIAGISNDDSSFSTSIATSISGTVQDYATVGTATPSGTVTPASVTTPSISCRSTSSALAAATTASSHATGTTTTFLNGTVTTPGASTTPASSAASTTADSNTATSLSSSASASVTADSSNDSRSLGSHASCAGFILLLSILMPFAL